MAMDMHHPFGFDWGDLVSIFTLFGIAAAYVHSNISRMAAESSRVESQEVSKAIEQLEKTMIEVNITLQNIREDRAEDHNRLEQLSQEVGIHRDWLVSDNQRIKKLEEQVKERGNK